MDSRKLTLKDMMFIALFSALICIFAQIAIPMPAGVPMTLQTLIIPLAAIVLGTKRGTLSVLIYMLLGAVGLPVFANFGAGIGILLGLTGGFIMSFPLMTLVVGSFETLATKANGKGKRGVKYYALLVFGLVLATIVNYAVGTVWFMIASGNGLFAALMACVVPFIPTTVLKIIITAILGPVLKTALSLARVLEKA